MKNPYSTLGVTNTATTAEIKAAYRRIAKESHPDSLGGSTANVDRFRAATDAYSVLTDPVQRARFDETSSVYTADVTSASEQIFATVAYVRAMASSARAAARSAALKGLAWLVGGALITGMGYVSVASSPTGGSYPVMWGAILFGGWRALRAFGVYVNVGRKANAMERDIWSRVTAE